MKKCIKTELWKALHDPMFLLSLLLGLIICVIHVIEVSLDVASLIPRILESAEHGGNPGYTGISLFWEWMGVDGFFFSSRVFSYIWPILAAIPFGWSYAKERKNGIYNQIVTRCNAKQYYIAKYIAVFTTGGLAVAIPLIADLLILALICPYDVVTVLNSPTIYNFNFLASLYFTKPWVYAWIWCGIDFLWGGTVACLCFLTGTKLRLVLITILTPFLSLFVIDSLYTMLRNTGLFPQLFNLMLSPLQLAQPVPIAGGANPAWAIFGVMGILVLIGFFVGYRQVVRRELV